MPEIKPLAAAIWGLPVSVSFSHSGHASVVRALINHAAFGARALNFLLGVNDWAGHFRGRWWRGGDVRDLGGGLVVKVLLKIERDTNCWVTSVT